MTADAWLVLPRSLGHWLLPLCNFLVSEQSEHSCNSDLTIYWPDVLRARVILPLNCTVAGLMPYWFSLSWTDAPYIPARTCSIDCLPVLCANCPKHYVGLWTGGKWEYLVPSFNLVAKESPNLITIHPPQILDSLFSGLLYCSYELADSNEVSP